MPAPAVTGVHAMFSDDDVARFDIETGSSNLGTGGRLQGRGLPELVREILDAVGLFPMRQREGHAPECRPG